MMFADSKNIQSTFVSLLNPLKQLLHHDYIIGGGATVGCCVCSETVYSYLHRVVNLVYLRQVEYDLPVKLHKIVDGLFEYSFLVTVGCKAFRSVFCICHRADAIALHSLRAEEGHVCGTC